VLAILVINERDVQNKILNVRPRFRRGRAAAGRQLPDGAVRRPHLHQVRLDLVEELDKTRESMNALMIDRDRARPAGVSGRGAAGGYVLSGETNLMGLEDLGDVEKLKALFNAFSRQRDMLHLLDQSLNAEGVQIFIGQESGYQVLDSCSIVAAPYRPRTIRWACSA
jgi:heat-inducible transcriptional repressor